MSFVQKAIEKLQSQTKQPAVQASTRAPAASAEPAIAVVPEPPKPRAPFQPKQTIALNRSALVRSGLLPDAAASRRVAEQFRRIKRPLLRNVQGRGAEPVDRANLLLVASALAGEGKTFTTMNLAFSLALERDVSVVLIDADVAKPHISRELGLGDAPGLLDALADPSIDIEDLVYGTDEPSLYFLPAGRRSEFANELLESDRMLEICATLTQRQPNAVLLFDSAPLLLTNEGVAVSHIVGQVVLVVRAGVTPRVAVQEAISNIGDGPRVGVVLNQASVTLGQQGYYNYGAYGSPVADERPGG
ncbi:MAG: hypothetical protein O9284_17240 [Steroidobacteraceae bacterium]|nr:hypothetical protein [Steroidobacteraceae bacterium]